MSADGLAVPDLLFGGVELGGTKCVCVIGRRSGEIVARQRIPTGDDPAKTLCAIIGAHTAWRRQYGPIAALGVGSFGPLDLDPRSPTYGFITTTSKPGWRNVRVLGALGDELGGSIAFDTDVSAAAMAEGRWGAAKDLSDHAYVTVGTGVGVGLVVAGRCVSGPSHPELGHIRVARLKGDDWVGSCPYHGDCVEGLASGAAIARRVGAPAELLDADHPVWASVVDALGQLLATIALATAPSRITLGGGVIQGAAHLLPRIRLAFRERLNGYLQTHALADLESFIQPPALGEDAGPLGALALAIQSVENTQTCAAGAIEP